jgi:cytochrome c2
MQISRLWLAANLIAIVSTSAALAGEDVGAGQEIYQTQCSPCHSNQPGVNGIGPSLASDHQSHGCEIVKRDGSGLS